MQDPAHIPSANHRLFETRMPNTHTINDGDDENGGGIINDDGDDDDDDDDDDDKKKCDS